MPHPPTFLTSQILDKKISVYQKNHYFIMFFFKFFPFLHFCFTVLHMLQRKIDRQLELLIGTLYYAYLYKKFFLKFHQFPFPLSSLSVKPWISRSSLRICALRSGAAGSTCGTCGAGPADLPRRRLFPCGSSNLTSRAFCGAAWFLISRPPLSGRSWSVGMHFVGQLATLPVRLLS